MWFREATLIWTQSRVLTEYARACGGFLSEAGMLLLDVLEYALRCARLHACEFVSLLNHLVFVYVLSVLISTKPRNIPHQ